MGLITRTTFITGDIPTTAQWNAQFDTIYNEFNGNVEYDNLDATFYALLRNATNLNSGTVSSARISGDYTGITAVGTLNSDVTIYKASNDGNPVIRLGSSATEVVEITSTYDSGAQTLDYVKIDTKAASGTANKGMYKIYVDESQILDIDDSGINLVTGKEIRINSVPVLTVKPMACGFLYNIGIVRATTTNAGDSVKITSADGTALSSTNNGWIDLPGTTAGQLTRFAITADVTILLTGATFGMGGKGDLTGALLNILAINDNGTLKFGVSWLGGRTTLLTTDTNATQANVNLYEEVLCNTAVTSSTNRCREIGYVRANFDDTGGAAEDLWAIQTGVDDCVVGQTCEGMYRPYNTTLTGFSSSSSTNLFWCQIGRMIQVRFSWTGTSNATGKTMSLPCKMIDSNNMNTTAGGCEDNSVVQSVPCFIRFSSDADVISVHPTGAIGNWTAANTASARGLFQYECGPAASFL